MNSLEALIQLLRTAFTGDASKVFPSDVNWKEVLSASIRQGVSAIACDGLQTYFQDNPAAVKSTEHPSFLQHKLTWVNNTIQAERINAKQWTEACRFAQTLDDNDIQIVVLKGFALSQLFPIPEHRSCTDLDCYLPGAYDAGNKVAEQNGYKVDCSYYKHSKIVAKGLTIENHQFLLPVKGSQRGKEFEKELVRLLQPTERRYLGESKLQMPSDLFNAVYVLAHAQEHFFEDGINLRHVCDWGMLLKSLSSCTEEFWNDWKKICGQYGLLSFGYALSNLSAQVCGIEIPFDCPKDDGNVALLMHDITRYGHQEIATGHFARRIQLVRNIFKESWKFKYFSDTSAFTFALRRICGYLFERDID